MDKRGGESDQATVAVDGGRLHGCDLMLTEALADQVEPGGERCVAKGPAPLAGEWGDDGCVRDFSGAISACALASAAASAPILSLECCMTGLPREQFKADCAGL